MWAGSSVWLEHQIFNLGDLGSNPNRPTLQRPKPRLGLGISHAIIWPTLVFGGASSLSGLSCVEPVTTLFNPSTLKSLQRRLSRPVLRRVI